MSDASSRYAHVRKRNALIFVCIFVGWLLFDQLTKLPLKDIAEGTSLTRPIAGIAQVTIVHNTGGAWGIFGGSPTPLAVISILVCVFLAIYLFKIAPASTATVAVGVGLICAGGIGNTIDRFTYGYVIDFINPTFIDFPVFNVADAGVTVGIALLLISFFASLLSQRSGKGGSDAHNTESGSHDESA